MKSARLLAWNDLLATGLAEVDAQHRQLIAIINELGELRRRIATPAELLEVLGKLRAYTLYHFQCEAALMRSMPVNEANRSAHLKAHQGFVERLERVAALAASHPDDVVDQLLAFLVKWLVHHITGVDMRMAMEIHALQGGAGAGNNAADSTALHDALIDTVSDLYDSLGERTFEMLELNRQLQAYRERQEEENTLAQDIIMRMMQRGGLSDSKLRHWLAPADTFSGDIAAALRSPQGFLYAILADATGHGLAAAITVLPVMTTFYSMAERDLPVADMLVELNRNLLMTLPTGRFVAAALLRVDHRRHVAEVWNGGMPTVLVLNPDGSLPEAIVSTHLPLGIARFDAEMAAPASLSLAEGSQFVMYSDGLTEASNPAGEAFGEERLLAALSRANSGDRLAQVQDAWKAHVGPAPQQDDVSLLLVD